MVEQVGHPFYCQNCTPGDIVKISEAKNWIAKTEGDKF